MTAFYRIKWAHNVVGIPSPTHSFLVWNILEGAKRRLSVPKVKKDPITPEILDFFFDKWYCVDNLYNQRTVCACLLGYSGFLRVSELLAFKRSHFHLYDTHMLLVIQKSKTDIYRDGAHVVIARTGTRLCPVSNVEKYFSICSFDSNDLIFRTISKTRNGFIFRAGK